MGTWRHYHAGPAQDGKVLSGLEPLTGNVTGRDIII